MSEWRSSAGAWYSRNAALHHFLELKGAYDVPCAETCRLSPPAELDRIWHDALLDTEHYAAWCTEAAGRFINHSRSRAADGSVALRRCCTYNCYVRKHGRAPPASWELLDAAVQHITVRVAVFGSEEHFDVVAPAETQLRNLTDILPLERGVVPLCIFLAADNGAQLPSNTLLGSCEGGLTMLCDDGTPLRVPRGRSPCVAITIYPPADRSAGGGASAGAAEAAAAKPAEAAAGAAAAKRIIAPRGTPLYRVLLQAWEPTWGVPLQDMLVPGQLTVDVDADATLHVGKLPCASLSVMCVLPSRTAHLILRVQAQWSTLLRGLRDNVKLFIDGDVSFRMDGCSHPKLVRGYAEGTSLFSLGILPGKVNRVTLRSGGEAEGGRLKVTALVDNIMVSLEVYEHQTLGFAVHLLQRKLGKNLTDHRVFFDGVIRHSNETFAQIKFDEGHDMLEVDRGLWGC